MFSFILTFALLLAASFQGLPSYVEAAKLTGAPLSFAETTDGELYTATKDGIYVLEQNSWTFVKGSDELGDIQAIYADPDGVLTVAAKGAWQYEDGKWTALGGKTLADKKVNDIFWKSNDSALIAATDGSTHEIWQLDSKSLKTLYKSSDVKAEEDEDDDIKTNISGGEAHVFVNSEGSIVASFGTNQYVQGESGTWTEAEYNQLVDGESYALVNDIGNAGGAVIGVARKGVWTYADGAYQSVSTLPGNVLAVSADGSEAAVGTGKGVWVFADGSLSQLSHKSMDNESVTGLGYGEDGTLYAADRKGNTYAYSNEEWTAIGTGAAAKPSTNEEKPAEEPSEEPAEEPAAEESVTEEATEAPLAVSFTDTANHWAKDAIAWAATQGYVNGYPDGTFQPDKLVNEAEFLALLFKANPEVALEAAKEGSQWYQVYYDAAASFSWPVTNNLAGDAFNRGQAARILAASQGHLLETEAAVQFLLDNKLANGKTGNSVEGFEVNDHLTRAEAVMLIKNLLDQDLTLSKAE